MFNNQQHTHTHTSEDACPSMGLHARTKYPLCARIRFGAGKRRTQAPLWCRWLSQQLGGLVVQYIIAIDVTRLQTMTRSSNEYTRASSRKNAKHSLSQILAHAPQPPANCRQRHTHTPPMTKNLNPTRDIDTHHKQQYTHTPSTKSFARAPRHTAIPTELRHNPRLDTHHMQQHAHTPSPKSLVMRAPSDFAKNWAAPKIKP